MTKAKVGINGMGRNGRLVLRAAIEQDCFDVVAVNDKNPKKTADYIAYLFNYTRYGLQGTAHANTQGKHYMVVSANGKNIHTIRVFNSNEPADIPWGATGAEYVVESTGVFTTIETASAHLMGGAKKVVISGPSEDAPRFEVGVNESHYNSSNDHVICNESCTTNYSMASGDRIIALINYISSK